MNDAQRKPQRIGELARKTGKTERTLRFYEEMDLLTPVDRTPGGFRLYSDDAEIRIRWIERLQDMGFSLPDIRDFLNGLRRQPTHSEAMSSLRAFYEDKLRETREKVSRLRLLEEDLQESLAFLTRCDTCAAGTVAACACFDHPTDQPPPALVAAVYEPVPHSDGTSR